MTLGAALDYARSHHPRLRASTSQVTVREAEARVPRSQWLPQVGATVQGFGGTANNSTALSLSSPQVDLPRIGGTRVHDFAGASWTPYVSTLAAVGISQEIFDFGRIAAQSAAADAAIEVEQHRVESTRLDIDLGVREAFYAVRAGHAVVTAAEDAYRRSLAHRDLAQAWVTQGLRSRIELERAEADLARFDVGRIRAQGGLEAAQAVFAAAVGATALTLDAAGDYTAPEAPLPGIDETLRGAAVRDPRIREALARIREQALRTRAIGAELRPDVAATGAVSGRAGGAPPTSGEAANLNGALPVVPNWDIGLVLTLPIFDATIQARRTASERTEDALRAQAGAIQQEETAVVEASWAAVRLAASALPALVRSVTAAHANYEQADARFRSGLGTSVELADAEALRTDAEIQLALGQFEIARTRARFARAIAEGL